MPHSSQLYEGPRLRLQRHLSPASGETFSTMPKLKMRIEIMPDVARSHRAASLSANSKRGDSSSELESNVSKYSRY